MSAQNLTFLFSIFICFFFFQNSSQNVYEYDAMCVITVLPAVIIRVPHELSQREQDFSDQRMGFPKPLLPDVQCLAKAGLSQNEVLLLHSKGEKLVVYACLK